MTNLTDNHTGIPFVTIQLQDALNQIKRDIESAIIANGEAGKNALIRSQRPIKLIHDVVKTAFLNAGIHPTLINPELQRLQKVANPPARRSNRSIVLKDKELCLSGYLKNKNQDVSIIPNNILVSPETLTFPTYLKGFTDKYGSLFTESVLSVNVRSQLSSVAKNFDTLYERTFAESLNFHLRFPRMVLGEVYMIVLKEYDSQAAARNQVAFKNSEYIEKYILAFQALNDRINIEDPLYKYERIALLIVDFSQRIPKLYNTTQELIGDGLLQEHSSASIDSLSFPTFVDDLLRIYHTRFPENSFN
ncbi:MAG: hypothetical protein LUG98_11320 [Tannerellaceae bacterium]|nr:hypothetical protein [Tannerellaceae bacterium]